MKLRLLSLLLISITLPAYVLGKKDQGVKKNDKPINHEQSYTPIQPDYVDSLFISDLVKKIYETNGGAGLPLVETLMLDAVTCPKQLKAAPIDDFLAKKIINDRFELKQIVNSIKESTGHYSLVHNKILIVGSATSDKRAIALAIAQESNMKAYIYKGSEVAGESPMRARLNMQRIFIEYATEREVGRSEYGKPCMIIIDEFEKLLLPVHGYIDTHTLATIVYMINYFHLSNILFVGLLSNESKLPENLEMILAGFFVPNIYFA